MQVLLARINVNFLQKKMRVHKLIIDALVSFLESLHHLILLKYLSNLASSPGPSSVSVAVFVCVQH